MKILITGGAGFVGSSLAIRFRNEYPNAEITVFDNLRRRGSELNLDRFKKQNIKFVHGDIRNPTDFSELQSNTYDLFVEASAEPSVLAGLDGSPNYLFETNLIGSFHCFEFARRFAGFTSFLSTSRVYSLEPLRSMAYTVGSSRFELSDRQSIVGCSQRGVAEDFPVNTARSLYGATKLASEYFFQEYVNTYGLKGCINRCGVLVGPGQFGKVDQGVFTMWVANHVFKRPLKYIGYGGSGKQVRDLLHPDDLFDALKLQWTAPKLKSGEVYNIGGGQEVSTSLLELTNLCREATGNEVAIDKVADSSSVDIPIYISNHTKFSAEFGWKPKISPKQIVTSIEQWIGANKEALRPIFAP